MTEENLNTRHYRIAGLSFDPIDGALNGGVDGGVGEVVHLRPQVARLLTRLLQSPDEVVPKDALIAAVWPEGRVVDFEAGLSALLKELRHQLTQAGLAAEANAVIETLPKRGVRLNLAILEPDPSVDLGTKNPVTTKNTANAKRWVGPVLSVVMAALVAWIVLSHDWSGQPNGPVVDGSMEKSTLAILPFEVYGGDQIRAKSQGLLAADAMLSALWRASPEGLSLLGRASIRPYTGQDPAEVVSSLARDLGASLIMEGRLVWGSDGVRINARLISAESFEVIWSMDVTQTNTDQNPSEAIEAGAEALIARLAQVWPIQ